MKITIDMERDDALMVADLLGDEMRRLWDGGADSDPNDKRGGRAYDLRRRLWNALDAADKRELAATAPRGLDEFHNPPAGRLRMREPRA